MNETTKQVLLSSFMRNSKNLALPDRHHKRGQMPSHRVQRGETGHKPSHMPYPDQRR